ncbi:rubredoxin [Dyadobacter psychrotolerans]|uniref:Rubredoxin n=1 Tax=Dyadobacter psychrotolerans TaxID=2541721 RepID=A0A4V6PFV2_9BACT|nr:rubredoxin [Dyadobacter psychrotolerans]TDE17208.1 rubredoxin [Dyadobacter psychrotolerans]
MRDYYNIKINLPGGIASPGRLRDILTACLDAKVRNVRFGSRQQLLLTVHYEQMRFLEKDLKELGVFYQINSDRYPNIISSYCGEEVFRTGQWLGASEYHTVLDSFDFSPELKVNISDSNQSFTPFFTGNLNFISSPEPHFWYLYIRPKQTNVLYQWRELIYTNAIGQVSKNLEEYLLSGPAFNEDDLYHRIKNTAGYLGMQANDEVDLPYFSLPYYEGFNRYESRTWLGLYRRDELFSVEFLLDVCSLCLKNRIGEICTTPWKSLIIKGIEDAYRSAWSSILGKHNINVRHAANELAWQTEENSDDGSNLKKELVSYFDKNDTRTFGLCFGIQTRPKSEVFGSVLIKKRAVLSIFQLSVLSVYDIYYAENFNPNSRNHILFEKGLFRFQLAGQVERLCRRFSRKRIKETSEMLPVTNIEPQIILTDLTVVHQCPNCFTVYDAAYGDQMANIAPGTSFGGLPETYSCPVCETPKSQLLEISLVENQAY